MFSKDQEQMFVSSILKISACEFGIDLDDVKKVTICFSQSSRIKFKFSVNNKMAGFAWLKGFQRHIPTIKMRKSRGFH